MRSVKGPKSALTDFIEENQIKLKNTKSSSTKLPKKNEVQKRPKKAKRVQYSKPFEAVNFDVISIKNDDEEIKNLLISIQNGMTENIILDSEIITKIEVYLSRNRRMSKFFFDFLVNNAIDSFRILDCSMIKDSEFNIPKRLKKLELYQCGQMRAETLNLIVESMPELEVLRVTGAFLIENFIIPSRIKILDVSNCSRLTDDFISNINNSISYLDELRLSYCYGFTRNATLSIRVNRLFICETRLSERFIIPEINTLSIKRCPNINSIPKIGNLEYLDAEGIVTLENIPECPNIIHLNISYCQNMQIQIFQQIRHHIKYLNVSHSNITKDHIKMIIECKSLEILDISWNNVVDDKITSDIIENLNLKKLFVFGCFLLTKVSVDLAYRIKDRCLIVGNPAETSYLLDEQ